MLELSLYLLSLETEAERDKLTLIYTRYLSFMYKVARKYSNHYGNEDDIVHESILKIIDNLGKIDLDNELASKCYIRTIVKNKARDLWRKENRVGMCGIEEVEFALEDEAELPVDSLLTKDGYEQLIGYIGDMSDTYREVCQLRFICGLKEREIAEALGITQKNVTARIARGRRQLIEKIKEGYQ